MTSLNDALKTDPIAIDINAAIDKSDFKAAKSNLSFLINSDILKAIDLVRSLK